MVRSSCVGGNWLTVGVSNTEPLGDQDVPYPSGRAKARLRLVKLLLQQLSCNHQPLNLAGPFADRAELHVAVILLGWIIFDETVPTVNLHAFVGALHGDF